MFISFNKISRFFKKRKKTAISLLCITLAFGGEFFGKFISEELDMVKMDNKQILDHSRVIEALQIQSRINTHSIADLEEKSSNNVKRLSFNNYIERMDRLMENYNSKTNGFNRDVGNLSGRVDSIEKLLFELNSSELKKRS